MVKQREFQKVLNSKPKSGRQLGRLTLEVATTKANASKQANGGDSDEEDEDAEEGETRFGNILIRRCPRSPYFLDPYGATPPVTVEETGSRGIPFPQAPPRKRRFVGADISRLRQMIRQQNQQMLFSQLYTRTMENGANLTAAQLKAFEDEKQRISRLSDNDLERDASRIDWDTIQASGFGSRTVKELEAEWKLFCDPNFERGPWTAAEDEALLASVERHKERYWDLVAADMSNRRLPVQYLSRYQQVLKPRNAPDGRETTSRSYSVKTVLKGKPLATRGAAYSVAGAKDAERPQRPAPADGAAEPIDLGDDEVIMTAKSGLKWTPEEDEMLVEAVKKFGEKNWASVATMLGGLRSGQQCLHRWQKTLNPDIRRGRWDSQEDNLLAMAVRAYGAGNWRLIHKHVPGRTDVQCRERWVNVLDPAVKSTEGWTAAEDAHLLAIVASQPPGRWSAIAKLHNEGMIANFYQKYPHLSPPAASPQEPASTSSATAPTPESSENGNSTTATAQTNNTNSNGAQTATMDEDEEVRIVPRPTVTQGRGRAQAAPPKPPSTRTDNQCWRRWKMLEKKPERPSGGSNASAAASPRPPSASPRPKSKKATKKSKSKSRKTPDWMRDDSDESDEEPIHRPRAPPSGGDGASADTLASSGRASSRLAAKQARDARESELAAERANAMDVDSASADGNSAPSSSTPRRRAATQPKDKPASEVHIERVGTADPSDPTAKPRLKLLIRRKPTESPSE